MKKTIASLLSLGLMACSASTWADTYKIDPAHTFVIFKISHLGISTLVGQLPSMTGTIDVDPNNVSSAKVDVVINLASLDTHHAERDKHLRGPDFFNVNKFTQASFKSEAFSGDENGGVIKGTLTFLGISQPLEVKISKVGEGKDPWGGYRVGFEGKASLNRKDFGMNYELGPNADNVDLEIYIEGIKA